MVKWQETECFRAPRKRHHLTGRPYSLPRNKQNQAGGPSHRRRRVLPRQTAGRRAEELPAMATAAGAAGAPRAQTLRDLAEEGKKRAVLLLVFAFGLAFLMSREFYEIRIQ